MDRPSPEADTRTKDYPPPKLEIFALGAASFLCAMLGSLVVFAACEMQGVDVKEAFKTFGKDSPLEWRNFMRGLLLLNHLCTFLLPALLVGWFFYKNDWSSKLYLDRPPKLSKLTLGVFFMASVFPVAEAAFEGMRWLTENVAALKPLLEAEDDSETLMEGLLVMPTPIEVFFSLIVMALTPAIGEEMVFRGLLQRNLVRWTRRPVVAILLTALVFSLAHFQVQRLPAIFLLGVALGCLYYWTKNLWMSITAHFLVNGTQVMVAAFSQEDLAKLNANEGVSIPWGLTATACVLMFYTGYLLRRDSRLPNETTHQPNIET
jgi:hypothetical protein